MLLDSPSTRISTTFSITYNNNYLTILDSAEIGTVDRTIIWLCIQNALTVWQFITADNIPMAVCEDVIIGMLFC